MEQLIIDVKKEPMALKELLRRHDVRYWQIVRRCSSQGVFVRENELSRILNGLEKARPEVAKQLQRIEKQLKERDGKT
jgi:predicted transcriptional regulator